MPVFTCASARLHAGQAKAKSPNASAFASAGAGIVRDRIELRERRGVRAPFARRLCLDLRPGRLAGEQPSFIVVPAEQHRHIMLATDAIERGDGARNDVAVDDRPAGAGDQLVDHLRGRHVAQRIDRGDPELGDIALAGRFRLGEGDDRVRTRIIFRLRPDRRAAFGNGSVEQALRQRRHGHHHHDAAASGIRRRS